MGITRVSPNAFHRQMKWMSQTGYRSSLVSEITALPNHDQKLFSIIFDDAYDDLNDTVFPVLHQLGFKVTLAIIADFVGKDNLWEARLGGSKLQHMDWLRLKQWSDAGHEIASHSSTHRCLTALSIRDLDHEIRDSKTEIENRLGVKIQIFVPPFGRIDSKVLDIIADSGYRIVCVNAPTPLIHKDLLILVRRSVHRFDTLRSFQRKILWGWKSHSNAMAWRITAFCSGGTVLAQRLFGNKNIP